MENIIALGTIPLATIEKFSKMVSYSWTHGFLFLLLPFIYGTVGEKFVYFYSLWGTLMYGKFFSVYTAWCAVLLWILTLSTKIFFYRKKFGFDTDFVAVCVLYKLCNLAVLLSSLLLFSSINRENFSFNSRTCFNTLHPCICMLSCPKWNAEPLFLIFLHILFSHSFLRRWVLYLILMF
jgi:hypothetical protein